MKKFLALVLALVMTMSLVTISAGAEDFTDAEDINYVEAVEVMTALGIVTGDTAGAFNPTKGLTRGAAAKIICNMMLGTDVAGALEAQEAPFVDVATSNVFAGYIAFCKEEGIIGGYPDGTFKPADPLTGYAFLKMLLGALGYDADVEGFNSSNYAINVAKLAKQRGLTDGNESYKGSAAITREEAMLYAFNTLLAKTVTYTGASNSTITIGDIVIKNNGTATIGDVYFAHDNFSDLTNSDGKTLDNDTFNAADEDFGRPAHGWTIDGEDFGPYADKADNTYVVTKLDTTTNTYANYIFGEDYLDLDVAAGGVTYKMNSNGAAGTDAAQLGDVIEMYYDANDDVSKVVVVREKAAQITEIKANTGKATTLVDGKKVVYAWNIYVDTNMDGTYDKAFNEYTMPNYSSEYAEDDYLAICVDASGNVLSTAAASSVTGAITKYSAGKNVTIDGVKYEMANTSVPVDFSTVDFKTGNYELVMSTNGFVLAIETVAAAAATLDDVVYTNGVTWTEDSTKYGKTTYTVYVQVVDMKGVVSDIVVGGWEYAGSVSNNYGIVNASAVVGSISAGLKMIDDVDATDTLPAYKTLGTSCTVEDYSFSTVSNTGLTFKTSDKKLGGNYLVDTTNYLLVKGAGADTKTATYVGGLSYKTTSGSEAIYVVLKDTGSNYEVAQLVIAGSTLSITDDEKMLYVPAASTTVAKGGYAQEAYDMTGAKVEFIVKSGDQGIYDAFVTYTVDADGVYDLTVKADVAIAANDDWDKTEVLDTDLQFVESYYANHITLKGANTLMDIPAENLVVVDTRTAATKNDFDAEIASIGDMITATKTYFTDSTVKYTVIGDAYVSETGAVVFFVTDTAVVVPALTSVWVRNDWTCVCNGEDGDHCSAPCNSYVAVGADGYVGATAAAGELTVVLYNAAGDVLAEAVNTVEKAAVGQVNFYTCDHDSSSWDGNVITSAQFAAADSASIFYKGVEIGSASI